MSVDPNQTTEATPLFDAIAKACWQPADLGYIARYIGMTPSDAHWAVCAAEEHGRIRYTRYGLWEAVK